MTRVGVRIVTALLVTGSAAVCFMPIAHADTTTTLTPTAEGWYQPNPSCTSPAGCLTPGALPAPPPVTSPFPARSMHVGLTAGQETARSYLALPLSSIFEEITAGKLNVPLDVAPGDGDSNSSTAKIQVCLATAAIVAVDGSFEAPPKSDCKASAPVTYVATPQPHLEADLAPLLSGLSAATGIVLLPDATKAAPTDSWRVVFSAHDRTDAAKTAPAAVTLTVADPAPVDEPDAPIPTLPDSGTPDLTAVPPPVGTGFAPAPTVETPVDTGAAPTVVPPAAVPQQVSSPRIVTVGYAYPGVWLLPLGFLVLIPAIARGLTKDLAPPPADTVVPA